MSRLVSEPAASPPPNSHRGWYILGAGLFALLVLLFVEGLARGVWHAIGGLIRLVWTIARVLWHLLLPG